MESILLNVNMGLGIIDENLDGLMEYFSDVPLEFNLIGVAKAVGVCLAIGVGAYESYMMMLGKKAIDVMKILRILILAICISQSGAIAKALQAPGESLMKEARAVHQMKYEEVLALEKDALTAQDDYVEHLRNVMDSVRSANIEASFWDIGSIEGVDDIIALATGTKGVQDMIDFLGTTLSEYAKEGAAVTEQFIVEIVCYLIRFLGEVVFQMTYYAMLVTQRIVLYLMALFMPLAFALSLAPPYKSAWSQYISKYLSISLWGFVIYVMMFFVDHILYYFISLDLNSYKAMLNETVSGTWVDVGLLGVKGLGTCCMYVVAMLIGAKVLGMAPEVAGWLIPGGVSSSAGNMAGGMAMGAAAMAGSAAGGIAGGAAGAVAGGATKVVGGVAAGMHASREGGSTGASIMHGIFSQTGFGRAADSGAKTTSSFGNWGKNKKDTK